MAFTTSAWNGSTANWTTAADWSAGEPDTAAPALAAVLAGSGSYTVTVNTNIGTIAASGAASSVGLLISDVSARLSIGAGGTLVVGAANGNGGLATITGADLVVSGGTFITTSTLTISSDRFFAESGGFAQVAAFSESNASIFIESGGTLAILGALSQTSNAALAFTSPGLLTLGDVSGAATIDLNFLGVAAPDARVFWTNAATADLANLTLLHFGATNTLDVATSGAVTITGTQVVSNKLTIATSGGNLVVGLGSGAAAQYFATTTTLGAQNIVRVTAGLTSSNWIDGTSGNWTAATDWDDAVPPGGSAANYAAVLGGSGFYDVTVSSNVGTVAAAAAVASTVGLAVSDNFGVLGIQTGGTLAVGAGNGNGGLVSLAGEIVVDSGGRFSATNTVSVSGNGFLDTGGVATVGALSLSGSGRGQIVTGGTLAITRALGGGGGGVVFLGSGGLLTLGDVTGTAAVDLNGNVRAAPDSRVFWTNNATADLANLTLADFGATNTLDVATSGAATITGTILSANALTIDTSGGNLVVGLGSGAAAQYFATTTTLGAQNIVRITAGLTTSNWLSANGDGNWTAATDWDDAVPPGGSASNYAAVLGGSGSYTVAVNSNIGTIAAAAVVASTVGLAVSDNFGVLAIQAGGTLAVGAANGNGGLVSIAGEIAVQTGGSFSATNTVSISSSGFLSVTGVATVAALSVTGIAAIISLGGTLAITGALGGAGRIEDGSNCLLTLGDASGAQTIDLETGSGASSDARVYWTNSATTADLANLTLVDFGTTATLDVATASPVTITGTQVVSSKLTIDTSGGNLVVGLGSDAASQYFATTTAIGGQNVVEITACFLRGTRIATPGGTIAVEDLREGDAVLTRSGISSVQWIGWRNIDCTRHPRPHDVWPVRIGPDAFGPGQPNRALRLSPDHAVFIDGVLIPVRNLVNGATIVQETAKSVSYWHVELPRHDILLAEGLECESYLDTGNRGAFANGGGAVMLHPDFAPPEKALRVWEAEACAALVRDGAELEAARSLLLERAGRFGHRLTRDPALRLIAGRREIAADCAREGRMLSATLPKATRRVRLVSRRFVPAHARPESDDWRGLGVAVTRVWLDEVEIARDDTRLEAGWHAPEAAWRWTEGAATLAVGTARRVRVEWADAGLYWDERDVPASLRARYAGR
jgi:hypothetical protein